MATRSESRTLSRGARFMLSAREIALASKGKRSGNGWQISCPAPGHPDREPSCTVIDGPSGPVFHCFAGCDWRDIRAGAETAGWIEPFACRSLRPREDRIAARTAAKAALALREAEMERDRQARIRRGRDIWNASRDNQDRVLRYFTDGRGIRSLPSIFRFNGAVWHLYERCELPAIVAPIENVLSGRFQGVHCIFLNEAGDGKADIESPKLSFGVLIGGAVQLAPADNRLALSEGIESGLSYMQLSGCPTWSTLGTASMKHINVPSHVQNVVIAADNDPPGLRAAWAAARQFRRRGLTAEISYPKQAGADWNDILKAVGQ